MSYPENPGIREKKVPYVNKKKQHLKHLKQIRYNKKQQHKWATRR